MIGAVGTPPGTWAVGVAVGADVAVGLAVGGPVGLADELDERVGGAVALAVPVGSDPVGETVGTSGSDGTDGAAGLLEAPDPVTASPMEVPVEVESEIG